MTSLAPVNSRSTTIVGGIAETFCTDLLGPQRMNRTGLSNPLNQTFPLGPHKVEIFRFCILY